MTKSTIALSAVFFGIVSVMTMLGTVVSARAAQPACETNTDPSKLVTPGCMNEFAVMCNAPVQEPPTTFPVQPSTATYGTNMVVSGPKGSIGGAYCSLNFGNRGVEVSGNVAVSGFNFTKQSVSINGLPANSVVGQCATDGGPITQTNACAGGESTDGTSPILAIPGPLLNATVDEQCYDDTLACLTPTATLPAINLAYKQSQTISTMVPGGLTIVSVPKISLGASATLVLSGGSNDQLILETPGPIQLGTSARIVLGGGLSAGNVFITATIDPTLMPASNSRANLGANSTVEAEFHSEGGCAVGANVALNGALICDFGTNDGSGLNVYHIPNQINLPACPTVPQSCLFFNTIGS
ncbi:MAG TPA: hypothetical protein VJN94_04130 [Candidatus Binataceae bacterium]|nr:hypothetical protein [Candidatus Binataceae bacterium]